MYDDLLERDTVVIAIAQEDKDLKSHGKVHGSFDGDVRFDIVADLEGKDTKAYKRTTAYLIDKRGVVREVFPMLIHSRPSWSAIIGRIDELESELR